MDGLEAEDQTDDDDEDDDEDQEDENDEAMAMDTRNFLDMDWQEVLPANAAATQGQNSSAHSHSRSSSGFLPSESDVQHPFNFSPTIVGPWNEETQTAGALPSSYPFGFVQGNFPKNNSHMPLLPDPDESRATSMSLQQSQSLSKPSATRAPSSTSIVTTTPVADTNMDSTTYTSQDGPIGTLNVGNNVPPRSRPIPPDDFTTRKTQKQGHNSLVRSRNTTVHSQDLGSMSQGHVSFAKAEDNERMPSRLSPEPNSSLVPPSTMADELRHVSIDATCTTEQLGTIMQFVAGLAKSVTVKVKS